MLKTLGAACSRDTGWKLTRLLTCVGPGLVKTFKKEFTAKKDEMPHD